MLHGTISAIRKYATRSIWVFRALGLTLMLMALVSPVFAAPSTFSWATNNWPAGSLSQTYTNIGSPTRDLTFTFTGDTSRFVSGTPVTNQIITGGLGNQNNLFFAVNYASNTESVTLTVDFSDFVTDVSFTVLDIDTDGSSAIDEIVVTGAHGAIVVTPTLTATNPTCVTVTGNIATATCSNINNNISDGNVLVSFLSAVDSIDILYREGAGAPADPTAHGIALHNIAFTPSTPTAILLQSASTSVTTTSVTMSHFLVGGSILILVTTLVLFRFRRLS